MKLLASVVLALIVAGPASAAMYDFSDDCYDIGGSITEGATVDNYSALPYTSRYGNEIIAILEIIPPSTEMYLKRSFHIDNPHVAEIARNANDTLKLVDICHVYSQPIYLIKGMKIRDS